jgi:DNA-binding XRE family transcriptional regulator
MTPLELKQARARLGWTQQQLAAELNVCRFSVYRWETGIHQIPRILTLAMKELERERASKGIPAARLLGGEARSTQTESKELNDYELQKILWACLNYWNREPKPAGDRTFCYSWIVRCYEVKFGKAFHHSKLRTLARLGFLARAKSSRCGTRRYYRIKSPPQIIKFLNGANLN